MSARAALVELLATELDTAAYKITGSDPDTVRKRTVIVWTSALTPQGIGSTRIEADLVVWVLVPEETNPEDALDEAILDLVAAMYGASAFALRRAERGVYRDTWHGWRCEVTAGYQIDPNPTETPEDPEE